MKKLFILILLLLLVTTASGQFGQKYLTGQQTFGQRYPGVSPEGLVLWFDQSDPCSYGDVSIWHDLSGNSNHGSQAVGASQPSITGADGLNGSCRSFDGIAEFIDIPTGIYIPGAGDMTVSIWFNTESSDVDRRLFYQNNVGVSNWIDFDVRANGRVEIILDDGIDPIASILSPAGKNDGLWHHALFTKLGNTIELFVDGQSQGTNSNLDAAVDADAERNIGRFTQDGNYFNGFIDIVMIFSRLLTSAEVDLLYWADKPRHGGV